MKYFLIVIFLLLGAASLSRGCACTRELMPVCGRQGRQYRTFSNRCMLIAENNCHGGAFQLVKDGPCRPS